MYQLSSPPPPSPLHCACYKSGNLKTYTKAFCPHPPILTPEPYSPASAHSLGPHPPHSVTNATYAASFPFIAIMPCTECVFDGTMVPYGNNLYEQGPPNFGEVGFTRKVPSSYPPCSLPPPPLHPSRCISKQNDQTSIPSQGPLSHTHCQTRLAPCTCLLLSCSPSPRPLSLLRFARSCAMIYMYHSPRSSKSPAGGPCPRSGPHPLRRRP